MNILSSRQFYKSVPLLGMVLLAPFFFWGGPHFYAIRSFLAIWDLGHLLFFTFFVLFIGTQRLEKKISWFWAIQVIILVLFLGVLIEIIQAWNPERTASGVDVVRDMMGAFLGVAYLAWRQLSKLKRGCMALLVGGILCWNIYPVALALTDELRSWHDFPLLAGFETSGELSRWTGKANFQQSQKQVRQGKYSLRISLSTAIYSGVHLEYFPHDWQGFSFLHLSIFNNEEANLPITVRVHDKRHRERGQHYADRFNRSFLLNHGWNQIDISLSDIRKSPKTREMDMSEINGVGIFVIRQAKRKLIYLDDVRLLK